MRKVLLLLSMFTNCAFAQYVTKREPIVEDLSVHQQLADYFARMTAEANEQYSRLQIMLAEYGNKLHNDEETLTWFYKYKENINGRFNSLIGFHPDEARNYAIRKQGEVAIDPELMARIRTANEYQAIIKSLQERVDMTQAEKDEWIANHPYSFILIVGRNGEIIGGKLGTKVE